MENAELEKAFRELRSCSIALGFSVRFKVVGGSMRPMITSGEEVEVLKVSQDSIRIGDIIAWKKENSTGSLPVIHRVVKRSKGYQGWMLLTKGDSSLVTDDPWVACGDIIGRVEYVHRGNLRLCVTRGAGLLLSRAIFAVMSLYTVFIRMFNGICGFVKGLLPSRFKEFNSLNMLYAYNACMESGWTVRRASAFREIINDESSLQGQHVADVQIGGGFSEEALGLLRSGFKVDSLNINTVFGDSSVKYDMVLVSDVINHIPCKERRLKLMLTISGMVRSGGRMVFICHNSGNSGLFGFLAGMRDRAFGAVTGAKAAGGLNDIYYKGNFIKHNFSHRELTKCVMKCGTGIVKFFGSGNVMAAMVVK